MHVDPTPPARLPATDFRGRWRSPALTIPALVAAALAAGIGAWLLAHRDRGAAPSPKTTSARPVGVSLSQLNAVASTVGHPIYWAGAAAGTAYELTRTSDGRVYIRYLTSGAKVGSTSTQYLTVGTYPQTNAFSTLQLTARKQGAPTIQLPGGGLAFEDTTHPTSFYVAFPSSNYQIEVYDPSPTVVAKLLTAGDIAAVPTASTAQAAATRVSANGLKAVAAKLGHPLFWAGAEPNMTYELTQTTSGGVYVRYLPPSVPVGANQPDYLTVGTYPQQGAFATLKAQGAQKNVDSFSVKGGGFAVVDAAHPTSVYVAFPGLDFQIEVYAPTAARARQVARSGRIGSIG